MTGRDLVAGNLMVSSATHPIAADGGCISLVEAKRPNDDLGVMEVTERGVLTGSS